MGYEIVCDRCGVSYNPLRKGYTPSLVVHSQEKALMRGYSKSKPVDAYLTTCKIVHLCPSCDTDVHEYIFGFKEFAKKEQSLMESKSQLTKGD